MTSKILLSRLNGRKLIRITGPDCYPYLQGILSNDIRNLYEEKRIVRTKFATNSRNVLSTYMMNPQGRAICDMLVYRTNLTKDTCEFTPPGKAKEPDELLIECDSSQALGLSKTLFGYRVRRKISVCIEENLAVWCLYRYISDIVDDKNSSLMKNPTRDKDLITANISINDSIIVHDPRLQSMGFRILTNEDPSKLKNNLEEKLGLQISHGTEKEYMLHRYMLGLGEGPIDHPESNCFPLECNGDYLNMISFDKGCYVGQELTTRIHHTGVVRKRLMPLVALDQAKKNSLPQGTELFDHEGKRLGLLRNVCNNIGLGLLKSEQAITSEYISDINSKVKFTTYQPYWWYLY